MGSAFGGFSQGEFMYIVMMFFLIIIIVFFIFQFPGTNEIYWGKAYPIGISAHTVDEQNQLKLSVINNYGGDIKVNSFKINGTWYDVEKLRLSGARPSDKTVVFLKDFKCDSEQPYEFMIAVKYTIDNVQDIFEGEVPIAGKCRGL